MASTGRRSANPLQVLGRIVGKLPGAIMIVPLLLGAIVNTFVPGVLDIGSFTTALFKEGVNALIGMFFFCLGAQIDFRRAPATIEKGFALLFAKVGIGVAVGLTVAFVVPGGTLWSLTPLAIIAAMTNSNSALYVSLTKQFGNTSDRGAVSVLTINDGPFITMVALGAAGLATFPVEALIASILPLLIGFVVGNLSPKARQFMAPGEMLLIPFMGFALGTGIDFSTFLEAGVPGAMLGLMTVILSGAAGMGVMWLVHVLRRRPKSARNIVGGAAEATTAGNAIATPAAVALADPSYAGIEAVATAQIAAGVVTAALIAPFLVAWASRWQKKRGVSPENEDAWTTRTQETSSEDGVTGRQVTDDESLARESR
ncbi:2-keto-3-deoxygluconate permease [Georgenia alba]|uniref:2-keto-3-deoxygluconate permease n=1 Tax=Georgenia alba TaxID=2233858 RepID=A0ABW2Q3W4_9MICO